DNEMYVFKDLMLQNGINVAHIVCGDVDEWLLITRVDPITPMPRPVLKVYIDWGPGAPNVLRAMVNLFRNANVGPDKAAVVANAIKVRVNHYVQDIFFGADVPLRLLDTAAADAQTIRVEAEIPEPQNVLGLTLPVDQLDYGDKQINESSTVFLKSFLA